MAFERRPKRPLKKHEWPPRSATPYRVRDNEGWRKVAAKFGMDVKDLIDFNFHTNVPEEINWYLHFYVGCKETPDRKNRKFSSAAVPGLIYIPTSHVTMPPMTITVDLRQIRARTIVQQFVANDAPSAFKHASPREQIAQELLLRIEQPWMINQGRALLCPSAAVVYTLAVSRPDDYVRAVTELYDHGRTRIDKWDLVPDSDLKDYELPKGALVPESDWLIMASIRDSENWFIDYEATTDEGGAWGGEVANWLRKAGYTEVLEEWNYLLNKDGDHLRRADRLYANGYHVSLLLHSEILEGKTGWTATPNHWVVLASRINLGRVNNNATVSMKVFTWGTERQIPRPGAAPMQLDDFLDHYYGFVACKY